ncbi:hypothetical protein ACLKA6_006811 [Drosophila palustris]
MFGNFLIICLVLPVGGFSPMLASNLDYYDTEFVIRLARNLTWRHKFETFITFASNRESEMPPGQQLVMASLERQLAQQLNLPIIVWGLSLNATFYKIITHKTLVFATIEHYSPKLVPMLDVLQETLDGRHNVYILFIVRGLSNRSPTQRQLKDLFSWCWSHNFVNVALTFQQTQGINQVRNELFSYTPFPKVKAINVTSFGVDYEWPNLNNCKVNGYEFRIPFFYDPPLTYVRAGELRGTMGSLIHEFIYQINGRMRLEFLHDVNRDNFVDHTMLAAARGEVDFVVHPYSHIHPNAKRIAGAFTFTLYKSCLMVPVIRNSVFSSYFRNIFRSSLSLFVILVIIMPLVWQICYRQGLKGLHLGSVIFYMQSLESSTFRRLPKAYKYFHIAMLMAVMIMTTMESAVLSASFSVKQMGPQINTIEDFLKTPLRIMITKAQEQVYINEKLLPEKLRDRLIFVNASTLWMHKKNFNTSYAYIATSTNTKFVEFKQRYLTRPLFKIMDDSQLCTQSYFLGLPIQFNSPFKECLFRFYLNSLSNGLDAKWISRTYENEILKGVYTDPQDVGTAQASITLKEIEVLMKIYAAHLAFCFLCLLLEILWKRLTHVKRKC